MPEDRFITIGQLAARTGVAVSAIRFYEDKRLLQSLRTSGNQRRFLRSGHPPGELHPDRAEARPRARRDRGAARQAAAGRGADAERLAADQPPMRFEIDQRINLLTRTRNQLDQCIGCGCLSLQKCQLYNKDDRMGAKAPGRGRSWDDGERVRRQRSKGKGDRWRR
jgi:MerR family redox-sensitive transcriptional activator SoxR